MQINGGMMKFRNRLCGCGKRARVKMSKSEKNPSKL